MHVTRPLVAAVMVALWATAAAAHAVLGGSTLQDGPVTAGTPIVATLRFNAAIEADFTKIVLLDADGHETPLEAERGQKPGEIRVRIPALSPGAYALRYKVLAADGHLTEEYERFRVSGDR